METVLESAGWTPVPLKPSAKDFFLRLQEQPDQGSCSDMIIYQLVIFVLFYLSLIVIIICMYVKYRRECKEMEKNEGSEANFMMVKRLMEQYDQKQRYSSTA